MKRGDYLFVYGSLRKGESADLSRNSQKAEFLWEDRINGTIFSVGWYPGVKAKASKTFNPDDDFVVGEVFLIRSDDLVHLLDGYEGYPNLFNRIETQTERGKKVWVYTYNHETREEQLVPGGDWKNRLTETNSKPTLS